MRKSDIVCKVILAGMAIAGAVLLFTDHMNLGQFLCTAGMLLGSFMLCRANRKKAEEEKE